MAEKRRRRATTPQGRENQLISLAFDFAEKQFIDGSASSQVTTHFLKLGSSRERLEQEKLQNENLLLASKRRSIDSGEEMREMYDDALKAMRKYQGQEVEEDYQDEYYD